MDEAMVRSDADKLRDPEWDWAKATLVWLTWLTMVAGAVPARHWLDRQAFVPDLQALIIARSRLKPCKAPGSSCYREDVGQVCAPTRTRDWSNRVTTAVGQEAVVAAVTMDHTDGRTSLREGFFAYCRVEPPVRPLHAGPLPRPAAGASEDDIVAEMKGVAATRRQLLAQEILPRAGIYFGGGTLDN